MKKHSFLLLASLIGSLAVGNEVKINSVDEFIQFKVNVNNGTNYEGTTVFLDSDLDFSGKTFEPIGLNYSVHFLGTFDGQGHAISNLVMDSSSDRVGLFGISNGLTIRNVILDSSCSIKCSYSSDSNSAFVGGIIGYCDAKDGPCTIENSVNMGSVSFTGSINNDYNFLLLGGIAGYAYSFKYDSIVKNCANYGDVTDSGTSNGSSYIGGIVGMSDGYSSQRVCIYNSLNYGAVTHKGTTSSGLYLGGLTGYTGYTIIENCVSVGKIESNKASDNYVGSIVGYVYSSTSINYCYFTSELSSYSKIGQGTPSETNTLNYDSTTFELSEAVTVGEYTGTSLIGALNAVADTNTDYSHWLLNKNKKTASFTINGRTTPISMSYQIMVLPSLASEGSMVFDGWYEDSKCTTSLTSYEITSDTKFYSQYGIILTVTFDLNGGESVSFASKKVAFNDVYGELPEAKKTGYSAGWFTERTGGEKVESGSIVTINSDHTLYAQWTINQYTVTFDFNNGTVNSVVLDYDAAIEYPEDMTRVGFNFTEWTPKPERMPAENITVKAQWTITDPTECVGILFSEEDLTESKAKEIVGKFVPKGAKYRIEIVESDSEGTKAIAKFNNKEKAKEFVEAVIASSEAQKSGIKAVNFISGGCSFATSLGLSVLAYFLAYLLSF